MVVNFFFDVRIKQAKKVYTCSEAAQLLLKKKLNKYIFSEKNSSYFFQYLIKHIKLL